jgi:hypothetical protein
VNHHTTKRFWKHYDRLPEQVKKLADKNFALLKHDQKHPSLEFKKIEDMWSVRVGAHYRALGFDHEGYILWFWIGPHAEYDRLMP